MLEEGNHELRKVYVDTLIELARNDKNIIALEADLAGAIGTKRFYEEYPKQFINCGIMEANMVGAAAGLALRGKRPYLHTFGSFAARRAFDQIFLSLAYAGLGAVIIGSDPGVSSEYNGGTHMPFEDIGLMRMLPNCNIVEASDEVMLRNLLIMSYQQGGLWYIRMTRKKLPLLYKKTDVFKLGKGKVLMEGRDAVIFSYGVCTADAFLAGEVLRQQGIETAVVDMFSIQPLDNEIILYYMNKVRAIITIENHQIVNGLGTAVSEVIAESGKGMAFTRIGIQGRYGQTGSMDYLKRDYGIDTDSIVCRVKELLRGS